MKHKDKDDIFASHQAHESEQQQSNSDDNKTLVALVDSRPLTRQSLYSLLKENARDFVFVPIARPDQIRSTKPGSQGDFGLIILHIAPRIVHEEGQGCTELEQLQQTMPDTPIVLFSDHDEASCVLAAVHQGVRGYIPTTLDTPIVIEALRLVKAGGLFVPAGTLLQALREQLVYATKPQSDTNFDDLKGLTPRQLEVLQLLREGKPNKIIAYELDVEESTIKVHVRHIMRKLKAINRTHAVFLANQCCYSGSNPPPTRAATTERLRKQDIG